MRRRDAISALAGALALGLPRAGDAEDLPATWAQWKRMFLAPDGRVVDALQQGASHSEGQGYGMVLAQAFGDRPAFAAMEAWAQKTLAIRDDALMAWRFLPGEAEGIPDWHNATDGDLFRAWGLLRAARQSGWPGFEDTARDIAGTIEALCLAPDPRAPSEVLLTPSAESPRGPDAMLFNPSYIMPRALRELGAAFDRPQLVRAADHGETVLAELAARGPVPDWITITPAGFSPSPDHSARHGYDAMRVALYLAWSGRRDHPAVTSAAARLSASGLPVPTVIAPDGSVSERSTAAGYAALRNLVLCDAALPEGDEDQSYYPATLGLMARIARRENVSCAG